MAPSSNFGKVCLPALSCMLITQSGVCASKSLLGRAVIRWSCLTVNLTQPNSGLYPGNFMLQSYARFSTAFQLRGGTFRQRTFFVSPQTFAWSRIVSAIELRLDASSQGDNYWHERLIRGRVPVSVNRSCVTTAGPPNRNDAHLQLWSGTKVSLPGYVQLCDTPEGRCCPLFTRLLHLFSIFQ